MNRKILLLASVFLSGSVLAAAAQTGGSPGSGMGSGAISATTHCLDTATGQPRLKSAAAGSGSGSGSSMGGSSSSSSGMAAGSGGSTSTTGSAPASGSASGSAAANLPRC
jgi:hypothetical protein